MIAILKKEISSFFASPVGYLVFGVFILINGLFLWVFRGDFNILDYGFADLSAFFMLAPWVLLFLIPAVTMRSFSEEKKQGTLELLLTKPVSVLQIVLGKFFGSFLLIVIALLPTLLYVFAINSLADQTSLDLGSIFGSYLGLLFLSAAYNAIGLFASSITNNQIVSFISALGISFLFFLGFESIADLSSIEFLSFISLNEHYQSIGQGVIDTSDIIYFIAIAAQFIWLTTQVIANRKKTATSLIILPIAIIAILVASQNLNIRWDLTKDQRYTLNEATKSILNDTSQLLKIDVFLQGEGFTSEFKKLQRETKQLLEEFEATSSNVDYIFINPLEDEFSREENIQLLTERGLTPMQVSVQQSGKTSQEIVFPWALASYGEVTVKIPLIKNNIGANQQDLVQNSVQHLEYAFADAFSKLVYPKRKKIAVLRGNGQLPNANIADLVTALRDYYFIAPFTLDSTLKSPTKTLSQLNEYDLIINAKPTEAFSEEEKYLLDQFIMHGGKSLWLLDAVAIDTDSLYNKSGTAFATNLDLNLTDLLFKYGVRINSNLVNDLYSAPITLASGEDSQSRFNQYPWFYSPLVNPERFNHPITTNVNSIKFNFTSQIDTLINNVEKHILLKSSELTKVDGLPKAIDLSMATKEPIPEQYVAGPQNLAVLLEGNFKSGYLNRVKPFEIPDNINNSEKTKMIIISDGDLSKNDVGRDGPIELGFDRFTGTLYGNKEFLLNAVNYLLDDTGLLQIRSKELSIGFLDQQKISRERGKWQLIMIALPLVILLIIGVLVNYFRKRKYAY
ncbi:MAG: gliding motility-associated ABC transporter substrate-binding protein GldG [bacterium]